MYRYNYCPAWLSCGASVIFGWLVVAVGLVLIGWAMYLVHHKMEMPGSTTIAAAMKNNGNIAASGPLGVIGLGLVAMLAGGLVIWWAGNTASASSPATGGARNPIPTAPTGPTRAPTPTTSTSPRASLPGPPTPTPTPTPSASPTLGPPPYTLNSQSGQIRVVVESVRVAAGTKLLSYRVRVENGSQDALYLLPENVITVDQHSRSYTINAEASTVTGPIYQSIQAGATKVGSIVLSEPLADDDTGTALQLRLGFGASAVTGGWNFDTLVPRPS